MRVLAFLILAIFLSSCQEPMPVTKLEATITSLEEDATLKVKGPSSYLKEIDFVDGKAQDTLMITTEGLYSFYSGWQRITTYLKPGAVVKISGDLETFTEEGTFANEEQQIVAGYFQEKNNIRDEHLSMRALYGMEPDSFLTSLETAADKFREHLFNTPLPNAVNQREQESFVFRAKHLKYLYPAYTGKDATTLPADLQDPLAGMDLTDEDKFADNPFYANLIKSKFEMEISQDTTGTFDEVFKEKISVMPDGNIRNAVLYENLRYMVGPNEKLDDWVSFFKEYSTDKGYIADMNEQYEAYQGLMKGKPSPSFDYENHKGGKTKLEELRGKYVYVDVWATWCGPCIGEIPSLKKKEDKYHGANVEFVSISIDDIEDGEKWRAMVDKKELGGVQLMADNAWNSSFPQEYKINGIPRFILIDPAGNIVSADAPRPSSEEFDAMFAEQGLMP
jgi:thiol-disulfide isomerase/thioredoxin